MLTPNMSDEELDSVFRRVADEYPEEMPAAAWERMEDKLATATAQQLRRNIVRTFGLELTVLALLLGLGYWLLPQASRASQQAAARPVASVAPGRPAGLAAVKEKEKNTPLGAPARPLPAGTRVASAPLKATAAVAAGKPVAEPLSELATKPVGEAAKPASEAVAKPAGSPLASTAGRPGAAAHRQPVALAAAALADGATRRRKPTRRLSALLPAPVALGPVAYSKRKSTSVDNEANAAQQEAARAWHDQQTNVRTKRPGTTVPLVSAPRRSQLPTAAASAVLNAPGASGRAGVALLSPATPAQLAVADPALPDSLAQLARHSIDTTQERPRPSAQPPYRVVVSIMGAPSVSAVRTAQSAQLGGDYGVAAEYRFAPRWRVRVGLISSQKRYQAASSDYQAPAAWNWFPGDYLLDARCRVTEIPIDLRFDVLRRPTYTVFGSLGVNSLLMRNERYSYDWTQNGTTLTKSAQVVNGSQHLLGVLNFAAGIERPLGARWALQAEPFWQMPLGGVGAGKVRLSSAGIDFSLKFNLLK